MSECSILDVRESNRQLHERLQLLIDSSTDTPSIMDLESPLYSPSKPPSMKNCSYVQRSGPLSERPPKKHISEDVPILLPPSNSNLRHKRLVLGAAGQHTTTNFFDEFKDKVDEIRNTPYSPPKIKHRESMQMQSLPVKSSKNLLIRKIERQNTRIEELEASVRQLKLQKEHLEIFNESLKDKDVAREENHILAEKKLQENQRMLRIQSHELQRTADWIRTEQERIATLRNILAEEKDNLRLLEKEQKHSQVAEKSRMHEEFEHDDKESLQRSERERLARLECENDLLRKELHAFKLRTHMSPSTNAHKHELQERLEASLRVISFYTSREVLTKNWYDEDSTEHLLLEDSTTMQLLRHPKRRVTENRKRLRSYFLAAIFVIRVRNLVSSNLDQFPKW